MDGQTGSVRVNLRSENQRFDLSVSCSRAKRVSEVDSSCRLLIVPLFRGSSIFESLILSHHSKFTCEFHKEEINDDDDDDDEGWWRVTLPRSSAASLGLNYRGTSLTRKRIPRRTLQ